MIKTFAEGELLSRLPFMNIAGGGVDPQTEAVHLFGGDVDVDRSIVDLQGPEARASQVEMKVRSMRLTLEAPPDHQQGRSGVPSKSHCPPTCCAAQPPGNRG